MQPPETHLDLLQRPLFAHYATVRADGAPQVNPMWFLWDPERGVIKMTHTKTRHNYRNVESLEKIAGECQVAEGYICRLFKRYAHQSPWQYVLRLKMRDAAQHLQAPGARVGDVAYEFGFSDPFQFSRTFRQVFGISPRKFMRLHRRPA